MKFQIREYKPEDFDATTILWRIAREKALPDFQRAKGYFFYQDRWYFREHILKDNVVYVAEVDGEPAGIMAIKGEFIDQLYIHPDHWRKGVGQALIDFARTLSPNHLWLYTHQINVNARAFYEKNGFVAEKFGISPAPELEPDVEYHWRA
jgi:GNAT superfamily N-acetyltransferase